MEKLQSEFDVKLKKREEENNHLLLSLDEVIERERETQIKFNAITQEAERLKAQVSLLEKRGLESERDGKSPNEKWWEGDDVVKELEDQNRQLEEELKWKVEQFKFLEEAHEKLRDQFHASKKEQEDEKLLLLDEISKLHGNPSVQGFDHEEVENLRHLLRTNEMEMKDVEYKVKKLEIDNEELLVSIKELHEVQIQKTAGPQITKVRSRLKALEQTHRDCSNNLKAREVELTSQSQKMIQELSRCNSDLKIKDQAIQELKKELEDCCSSLTQLKLQNEELSLMSQLSHPGVLELQSSKQNKNKDDITQLMEQLTLKNISLAQAQNDMKKEREEKLVIQKELERCKWMLEESSDSQLELMEQAAEIERKLTEELQEVFDALERLENELTDKTNEGNELEYELQSWQSITDRLKNQLDESVTMRKGLEKSLIAQVETEELLRREIEEKDNRISNLEQQIFLFDQEIRIEEEGEDDTIVKIVKIRQPLHHDDREQQCQDLHTKDPQQIAMVSKQRPHDVESPLNTEEKEYPQQTGVVSKQRSLENPQNTDDKEYPHQIVVVSKQRSHDVENSLNNDEKEYPQKITVTNKQMSHDDERSQNTYEKEYSQQIAVVSKQNSHDVENPQNIDEQVCSLQPNNSDLVHQDMYATEVEKAKKESSQPTENHPKADVVSIQQSSQQQIKDPQTIEITKKQDVEGVIVANNESLHVQNHEKFEEASKQCTNHVEKSNKIVMNSQSAEEARKQSTQHIDNAQKKTGANSQSAEEAMKQSTQHIGNVEKKNEVTSKQSSQQKESPQQNQDANKQTPPEKKRLTGRLANLIQGFESGKPPKKVEGEICVTKDGMSQQSIIDERSPFKELNQDIFKKKTSVAI